MTFVIADPCVGTCDTACVSVCPVDCIHGPIDKDGAGAEVEGLESVAGMQLYIHPDECIDCGACEPECPVDAIVPDNTLQGTELDFWMKVNTDMSAIWPNITEKKDPMPEAEEYKDVSNKYEQYFSDKPGEGN